jgi:hypothetical protein
MVPRRAWRSLLGPERGEDTVRFALGEQTASGGLRCCVSEAFTVVKPGLSSRARATVAVGMPS